MAHRQLNGVIGHIRKLGAAAAADTAADAELLARFVEARDDVAFGTLIKRHGTMVTSVCHRVLLHTQDAEDACQATFLVLAKRAASIKKATSLGSWLHGVAFRVASNLRVERDRRRTREKKAPAAQTDGELSWREVQSILDEELVRLPETLRAPVLLCLLEGKTRDEAALDLGWSLSTLKGRLERGRKRLQERLVHRGLTFSVAMLGIVVSQNVSAMAPTMVQSTVHGALLVAAGQSTAGIVSNQVSVLVKGALQTMLLNKMKFVGLSFLALSMLLVGGLSIHQATATDQPPLVVPALPADLEGPTIVVLEDQGDKKEEKKDAKADDKTAKFRMEGVLEEIDAKEGYVTLRDQIRSAHMELTLVKGKDGTFNATMKLGKPTVLKNLRFANGAKITDEGKEKKLADLKPGTSVRVDLEYRRDGLVIVGMQKTAAGKGAIRIEGDGGIVIKGIQLELKGKEDKKKEDKKKNSVK